MLQLTRLFTLATLLITLVRGDNIILANDDGWAELNIRTFFNVLSAPPFSHNVVLSAPAENESGTGSTDEPATVLNITCEFDTCPIGSPPEGFDRENPRLNYVNSFPVPAIRFGIQTLAPKFFHGPPKFAVSGFNVGQNTGSGIKNSGTVGAATEAALLGIPAIAFSGGAGTQISFTSSLKENFYAEIYAQLSAKVTQTVLDGAERFPFDPILPKNIWLNVNFSFSNNTAGICGSTEEFKFIFTRINNATVANGDIDVCNNHGTLPTEDFVFDLPKGCFTTISVANATDKLDADATNQEFVHERISSILSCL